MQVVGAVGDADGLAADGAALNLHLDQVICLAVVGGGQVDHGRVGSIFQRQDRLHRGVDSHGVDRGRGAGVVGRVERFHNGIEQLTAAQCAPGLLGAAEGQSGLGFAASGLADDRQRIAHREILALHCVIIDRRCSYGRHQTLPVEKYSHR
ncbi:hypothetical protein D3C76_736780 [compost metagenome]